MATFGKYWWKVLLLAVFATFIDILGHVIDGTFLPQLPLSVVSKAIGMRGTVVVYFIVWFAFLAAVCLQTEQWLAGSRWKKGVKYGIAFGLMMYFAACETSSIFGTPITDDLRIAAADAFAFVVFGLLAGRFLATEGPDGPPQAPTKTGLVPVITITLLYVIGRYFAYSVLAIESGYAARPVWTFIWTFCMGLSLAVMYLLIGRKPDETPMKKALLYGLLIVGEVSLFGNLFYPFQYASSFAVMVPDYIVGRSLVDMVFVTLGVFLGESAVQKYGNATNRA